MRIILTAILVLCSTAAFAQTKKFRWSAEVCEYESTYDSKKYTVRQLEDTRKLFFLEYFPNTIDATPRNAEEIKDLRVETLNKEYTARVNALNRLNIIKTPYWEHLRQKYLKELEQVYLLSRASILAYKDPTHLRDVKFAGACMGKYGEPLNKGGNELLTAWRILDESSRKRNADPDSLKREFDAKSKSPEKLIYARIDVMAYGWWNCVNALIDRDSDSIRHEKEFRKLFIRTKTIECEEP